MSKVFLFFIFHILFFLIWVFRWTKKGSRGAKIFWGVMLLLFFTPIYLALIICKNGCGLEGVIFSVLIVFLTFPAGLVLFIGIIIKLFGEIELFYKKFFKN